jgi:PUA domain protein
MQVDRGAIKFVMSGANVMCPGLTSPGGRMDEVAAETVVVRIVSPLPARLLPSHPHVLDGPVCARVCVVRVQGIFAEGKEHALAIGHTKMSSEEMYARLLCHVMPNPL